MRSIDSAGCAEDISEGGLHVNTRDVLETGTRLALRIELPDRTVVRQGEVMWAIRIPEHRPDGMVCGMGIRFLDADPDWLEFFRAWRISLRGSGPPSLPDPWEDT